MQGFGEAPVTPENALAGAPGGSGGFPLMAAGIGIGLLALAWVLGERHAVGEMEEAIEDGDLVVPEYDEEDEEDEAEDDDDDETDDDIEEGEVVEPEAAPVGRYRRRR